MKMMLMTDEVCFAMVRRAARICTRRGQSDCTRCTRARLFRLMMLCMCVCWSCLLVVLVVQEKAALKDAAMRPGSFTLAQLYLVSQVGHPLCDSKY